jgi:RimJ/RimL family protein N-acetyltransferase
MKIEVEPADRTILSERLALEWMSPAFMNASLEGRSFDAEAILNARLPDGWPDEAGRHLKMRLDQMRGEPAVAAWLLRGMVRAADRRLVGYINFHGRPAEGRADLGDTVLAPYRRRGFARAAALAMMQWAAARHGVNRFVLSISPGNAPSLALAGALGFTRTGSQMDEVDGEEWVFEREWTSAPGGSRG